MAYFPRLRPIFPKRYETFTLPLRNVKTSSQCGRLVFIGLQGQEYACNVDRVTLLLGASDGTYIEVHRNNGVVWNICVWVSDDGNHDKWRKFLDQEKETLRKYHSPREVPPPPR